MASELAVATDACRLDLENGAVEQFTQVEQDMDKVLRQEDLYCVYGSCIYASAVRAWDEISHGESVNPSPKAAQGPLHRNVETF